MFLPKHPIFKLKSEIEHFWLILSHFLIEFLVKLRRWFFKSNRKRDRSSFIFYGNYSVLYYCTLLFINSTLENYFSLVDVCSSFFSLEIGKFV